MKKFVFSSALFLLVGFSLFFPQKTLAQTCGAENLPCCISNVCDQGLTCSTPGNNLGIRLCVKKNSMWADDSANKSALCSTGIIKTAIGCIPVSNNTAFISFILSWASGVGGGIAFILIIIASFMVLTSSGNPERLKAGQELLTSAIAGLIMIIFSVFILKVIGVDILGLSGL